MRTINSAAMAVLAMFAAAAPALAQDTDVFVGNICEIDTSELKVTPPYLTPDGTSQTFTFDSTKLCTGVASKRNIKLECVAPLVNWGTRGDMQVKNLECTINGDQCGLSPKEGDPNAPYLTATQSVLKVKGGIATLTCYYKP